MLKFNVLFGLHGSITDYQDEDESTRAGFFEVITNNGSCSFEYSSVSEHRAAYKQALRWFTSNI